MVSDSSSLSTLALTSMTTSHADLGQRGLRLGEHGAGRMLAASAGSVKVKVTLLPSLVDDLAVTSL